MTRVVNIYKEQYEQYIGRAGRGNNGYFGNPYPLSTTCSRSDSLVRYKEYFYNRIKTDPEFKKRILDLNGKTLGCFCKPQACHGDIIVEYLTKELP